MKYLALVGLVFLPATSIAVSCHDARLTVQHKFRAEKKLLR